MNYPKIVKILKSNKEAPDIRTIKFEYEKDTKPGQFFMIWIPGIDEIPMSVSYIDKKIKGFTFRRVGKATNHLFKLKKGDKIGVRGPLGNGFKILGKNILFVGGGTGIAMLAPAVEQVSKKYKTTVVLALKTKKDLFFYERIKKTRSKIIISTDDGTKGIKGIASDVVEDLLKENNYDQILTCGPELMMKKIVDITGSIPLEASLERYIKCGIGLCGQCCVGEGIRVCKDGPIFSRQELKKIKDFGVYKKDASGIKVKF
jgi:dihydroorotate dehydrogenase electron transfer subunit